ncbi:mucin-17 isoform X2 [Drosophila eugracilis]|uniref:mucin-17 isoform X2 n=1 Tax=Drosophila eugracilis TaxID=29029 RepID=UPI001BDAA380|nr:mucin-17 isoform X2 [Drosophila eugracilis]
MEDIEYLDEYKDLVMPGIKSGAPPASAGVSRHRRISSDSSNSSSIDADIFQKLFHGKYLNDEVLNAPSGSKSQDRRRRSPSPSSSSSDESNDALEALFNPRSSKSKPIKRRERYESFDSVDDLGEALMRPMQKSTVHKSKTSQAGGKKLHAQPSHRSKSSSSSHLDQSQVKKPQTISSTKTEKSSLSAEYRSQSAKNRNRNSTPTKSTGSLNGSSLSSAKNKTVTIIKAQRADVTASKQEPKTDPLTLQNLYDDSDSDSSYEYESDFYGDYDSDEEDEPVIDISTDTSRTTSVADTVTPVVSDDEGQDLQSEQNERSDNNQESILSGAYERLQSYLSNLSCAEAPPIYKKQNSARKSRSNEKKPSSSEQVKHANERPVASDKEETDKKERLLEPPEASSSAKSSASKASVNRKLYAVDANVTLESVERMSHDLAEQIMEIDVEFEKRSGSKTRSGSKSKISADSGSPSLLSKSHVRKLTYSSEQLDDSEPSGTMLRRSKSESFPKQERSRGEKQRKSRAATTDEKTLTAPEGQGETPKKKRGRPRKIIPNKETLKVETTEKPTESLDKDISQLIEASGMETAKETIISKEPIEHDELNADLDKAKDFAGFDNLSQDDNKINSSPQETDIKSAPDRGLQLDEESIRNLEKGQLSIPATSVDTLDTAHDHRESESATNLNELVDTTLITQKDDTKKDSATESIENIIKATEDVELPGTADANAKTMEVSENILEQSDSQLAEDIKLAEEILAAEVGKGIEVNEVVASVEGEQDPVTEIVKELVQETISQVAVIPNEQEQPDENSPVVELNVADKLVENHDEPFPVGEPNLADEPVEKQTVDDAAHPPENEPHADEQKSYIELTPVEDQHSIVEEETTAAKDEQSDEQNQAQAKEEPLPSYEILPSVDTPTKNRIYEEDPAPDGKLLQSSQDPPSIVSPAKKQNHSSPANTPKKSRELEALGSSVPRRSLRSDKATPQNQRSSRSRRSLRTELTQLLDESSRRSSPRLGKSPAESHSSQERSPVEKKVITSKLAKEKIASENGMVVEEKSHPPESATNVLNDIKTTEHIGDADPPNISAENLSAAEIKKESLGTLKSKKSRRSRGSRRKKPTSELHEELATTIKCAEEFSTCSESEQKNEERGDLLNSPIAEPPVSNSNSAVEQSVAKVSDTEQSEEKPLSPRKTRRMVKERDTSESETPSDYLQAKSDDNPSTTHSMESVVHSETQGCNTVAVIEERTPGRLSRRDKAIIDAGKSQKVERPSAKSQSAGRKRTSKEKPSNQSHNKVPNKAIEPIITDNDKEEDKSKSEEKSSDSSSESNPEKISSEVITKQSMQDQENADSDSILKESAEDLAKVSTMVDDKKPIDKVAESNKEQCLNTEKDKPASSDEPESGPISIELSIDSAEPKESEVKSKVRSKKEEKNPKESESENDKGSGVKTKTASSSSMASVEKTMVTPEVSKGKTIGIGSGRIRKRRQAVPIEDPEDTFGNTTLTENETPAVSCFSDKDSDPFSPFIKIPSKTYIMSKRIKTPSSPSSEALENVPKTSDLELTLEGKSEIKKELLTSIPSTSEISESLSSNEVKELSSPTQNTNESSTTSIAPIKRHQRTKKSYGARSKSSKSKTRKSNNTFENSTNIASESSTSTNQKEPSSPTVSCRKLRVLIKRTPTLDWTKNTKKTSSLNKNSAKSKRLNKIIESIEPSEQCDNNPETALVETSPGLNTDPESFPEPDLGHETNKILNEVVPKEISENLAANTNNEQKNKLETDQDELVEDVETSAEGENPIPNNSPVLEEPNKDEFKSITNATHEGDISEGESPELQVPNEESVKLLHPIKETPSDHKSSEESASLAKTSEDEDIVENELSTVASALTEPETDVTDDEEPAQSPIPDSTETTSVMDEPEATTSSVVKRSLRKREVDSSQPDEAAKRKQRQDKKSVTDKKEFTRPARRHHLPEEEERPVHKRSKLDSESRTKFISIIGKETIMSSTTAPVRETRSETTSTYASARKSAAKESKRSEINKPMLLGQSAKKLLRSNSPIPFTKKPMVQTLLSSTLSLHKPASGEDGSSVATRKSLNKADREENKASDQPILSSSIVVTKKSLPSSKNLESLKEDVSTAVPRKVNISVSVVPLKETSADTSMAPDSTPETSPILQRKAQKASRKSETNRIVETKKKAISVGNVNQFIKSEESEEITETSPSSAVIGRKILPQLESQIKTETMASEGASLAQRSLPQTDFSNKPESRKSETVKNIRTDYSEEMGKVARGRETSKKRTSAQRRSKHKSGLLSSEVETTSDSRDSSREDRTSANRFDKHDNPASVSLNKSVKKTRSSSSNRSLTFTPIPISGEQQNDSKDRFTPILDQNRPAKHTPSLGQSLKGRGRGGPPRPVSLKRKAEEGADHSDVANLKRSREREEDLRCQDVPDQDGALKAFPVKIIAARLDSSVDPEPVSSAAKPADHKTKIRKLRVKINRRSFNKWLRATCESKSPVTKASSLKLPSPSPQKATSETESAAESESTFKPQEEPVETLKTVPPYQPDSCPSPAPEFPPLLSFPLL